MSDPTIADRSPAVLELAPGRYAWCACGLSANQPFCDGSHKGTDFRPHLFTLEEPTKVALCRCKRTGNRPYCDGSHERLPAD